MERELKIEIPEGYEIDREKSSLERIVFKKKEYKLPESWEDLCDMTPREGYYMDIDGNIANACESGSTMFCYSDRNLLATKEDCEAHRALMQLHRLRDCYRQGWVPKMENVGFSIKVDYLGVAKVCVLPRFLSFQSKEIALKFLHNFLDLILTAKDLLR